MSANQIENHLKAIRLYTGFLALVALLAIVPGAFGVWMAWNMIMALAEL
jgi:hypothetical protein